MLCRFFFIKKARKSASSSSKAVFKTGKRAPSSSKGAAKSSKAAPASGSGAATSSKAAAISDLGAADEESSVSGKLFGVRRKALVQRKEDLTQNDVFAALAIVQDGEKKETEKMKMEAQASLRAIRDQLRKNVVKTIS